VNGSTEEKSSAMSQKPKELPFQGLFIQDKKSTLCQGRFFLVTGLLSILPT